MVAPCSVTPTHPIVLEHFSSSHGLAMLDAFDSVRTTHFDISLTNKTSGFHRPDFSPEFW
jgi:hypothetical protein